MITTIKLDNFKCFKSEELQFKPLTVFCGGNASGKSTAIQSLLLLRQSHESGYLRSGNLQLNGKFFNIGMVKDLVSFGHESRDVGITIDAEGQSFPFIFGFLPGELMGYALHLRSKLRNKVKFLEKGISYLSAERIGPRSLYDISNNLASELDVGVSGEYTAAILEAKGGEPAPNAVLAAGASLMNATKTYMQGIVPKLDISSELIPSADKVIVKFNNSGQTGNNVRPGNTGFGISYTLPIIVAALLRTDGDTLIVENPEAHLHPSGQSIMGQFLCRVAQSGVQVIVETHSDHVINGIRVFTKETPSFSSKLVINSLKLEDDGRRSKYEVEIDTDGNFKSLPPSFFDQIELDLMRLF